ncbi:uncharacterized protein MYCFIDRAFT_182875 [Pseudocercospora fijiensis CIRAD86]|uniref:Uncharacterized protein n=1 Tax=Pseudocercospora fijiensis (strain CIRAD86) TaxID=383855 RepID=M2ZXK2_PSEFD|nr:uncharacterized protein MYCFIDRAFT_182875 [Pseudocercospora fijiensis CIRAD86]EME83704.1 hypothetical protein MYCFIDRAFT_182875 [Pseudocercospora fijiensis CIRAD86]
MDSFLGLPVSSSTNLPAESSFAAEQQQPLHSTSPLPRGFNTARYSQKVKKF